MAKRVLNITKPILPEYSEPSHNHGMPYNPSLEIISETPMHLHKPLRDCKYTEMHIMAYLFCELSNSTQISHENLLSMKGYEKRLCSIKCYDNGLVQMTPGISNGDSVYQFQINEDVFQYQLQLISKQLNPADEETEWKIYSEYYNKHLAQKQSILPTSFQQPPLAPGLRVMFMGEISSAQGFNGESIYIHYLVDLCEGWTVEGGQLPLLSAYTQCSNGIYDRETGIWHARFSFPMEIITPAGQNYFL
ncbi:Pleiotropic negative transcriptional regulator, partial [Physocladia obscura]